MEFFNRNQKTKQITVTTTTTMQTLIQQQPFDLLRDLNIPFNNVDFESVHQQIRMFMKNVFWNTDAKVLENSFNIWSSLENVNQFTWFIKNLFDLCVNSNAIYEFPRAEYFERGIIRLRVNAKPELRPGCIAYIIEVVEGAMRVKEYSAWVSFRDEEEEVEEEPSYSLETQLENEGIRAEELAELFRATDQAFAERERIERERGREEKKRRDAEKAYRANPKNNAAVPIQGQFTVVNGKIRSYTGTGHPAQILKRSVRFTEPVDLTMSDSE